MTSHSTNGRPGAALLVGVVDWQQQCCGEPFSVGSLVSWTLTRTIDATWVADRAGPELGAEVAHVEDHHDLAPTDVASVVRGRVARIRAVSCRFALDPSAPDGRTDDAVPGTAVLDDLRDVDPWFEPLEPLQLAGFVVDLHPVPG